MSAAAQNTRDVDTRWAIAFVLFLLLALTGFCVENFPVIGDILTSLLAALMLFVLPFAFVYQKWLAPMNSPHPSVQEGGVDLHCVTPDNFCENPAEIIEHCIEIQDEFARFFGKRLKSRMAVWLYPSEDAIEEALGKQSSGVAFPEQNAICIVRNHWWREIVRHEVVHLFSIQWGEICPALKGEGLATWLQGNYGGVAIDTIATQLLRQRVIPLSSLLDDQAFRCPANVHAHYVLAGSFTGFLIRRFGKDDYRRFYREANSVATFEAVFQKCFGMSQERAERKWRNELLITDLLKRKMESD